MAEPRFPGYADFWLYYLRQHARPRTRLVHGAGTLAGLALLGWAVLAGQPWLAAAAVLVGYGAAWASHLFIEGNRPATFGHPLWSLASDLRMAWLMLTGGLTAELRRAGVAD
ncbi:DUF962 domain-containing protein [Falsiroseomonas selenitidurans]|uniref:DUF962 domain-containing protein n=1 Tax=Falsiroseomonas selenitidurans TaxID=2716335 RepID=A0ABX1DXF9_9PROT|nr:DUF962 domain-containing protein [Falsiroseomonas selenitidurans]NKC29585.1 DUF962 domain-containing protein [Falsiroseomonas selenitidurans]